MNSLIRFTWCVLLFGLFVCPAQAEFSSLYIFGDGVSTTTNNPSAGSLPYYGLRRSNGRVWVEVLAQELNISNNYWYSNSPANHLSYTNLSASSTNWSYSSNNWSYYGHASTNTSMGLVTNVNAFAAPADASNALFIVWINDANFVDFMGSIYPSTNIVTWTNAINQSLTNQWQAITNLYFAKGARALVMPDAVDITEIPNYNTYPAAVKSFVRQMVIYFNAAFTPMLSNAMVSCPGLKIYEPDFFSLLDNILANPASYGVTNALYNGQSIDAIEAYYSGLLPNADLNGPGANYIFWDLNDPTAKVHAIMADVTKQLIVPVQTSKITSLSGSNRLDLVNIPVGLNGIVQVSTDLTQTNWTPVVSFTSTNDTLPVFIPNDGPVQFYRLSFPFAWTWP